MKVLGSKVLLKVEKTEGPVQKIGSMEFKSDAPEYERAEVINCGPDTGEIYLGETVLIYPGAGKKISVDGVEYRVVSVSEIIVVL